jgi:polyhydroxyalkanoic acid synthase PhaR subunit
MANPAPAGSDPFTAWRDWVAQSERQWNSFLNEAMATDEFAESMGRFMDVYLSAQKNVNEVMGRYFTTLNVPTRQDVLSLGSRLSEIENRLDGIERALAVLRTPENGARESQPMPRPPRTKKPSE